MNSEYISSRLKEDIRYKDANFSEKFKKLVNFPDSVKIVADIECGPNLGIFSHEKFPTMYAIDPYWGNYGDIKENNDPKVIKIKGNSIDFKLPEKADIVVTTNLLGGSSDISKTFSNILSNLKKDGYLIIFSHLRAINQLDIIHKNLIEEKDIDSLVSNYHIEHKRVYKRCPISNKAYKTYVCVIRNRPPVFPIWFHQKNSVGIGDFLMLTPTIKKCYDLFNRKIPVFFDSKEIESLYVKSEYIEILDFIPNTPAIFTSSRNKGTKNGMNKYLDFCNSTLGVQDIGQPFVDDDITFNINKNGNIYIALINGKEIKQDHDPYKYGKDLRPETRQYMIDRCLDLGITPVILGNSKDIENFWQFNDISKCENFLNKLSLKDSVSVLKQCDGFISNDTGLYHIASAMKKKGLVIWRDTECEEHRNPLDGDFIQHHATAKKETYFKVIDDFIRSFLEQK